MAKARSVILATLKDHVGINGHRIEWEGGKVYTIYRNEWPRSLCRNEWRLMGISDSYHGALRIVAAHLEKESAYSEADTINKRENT
jgi:hypothetical protein